VDDGSCRFDTQASGVSEAGTVHIIDTWQRIFLRGSYDYPLVYSGVMTRQSTAQAIVRLQSVSMDSSGIWSFAIRAEQKSCHFAKPPPTVERVSYLVVEAGVSIEGWQAGVIRVYDREWHRVSLLRRFEPDPSHHSLVPAVISQVQNYESRTTFLSTRHHVAPGHLQSAISMYRAFFVHVQGEGVWCPDTHYYAEYFGNIELAGTPVAALCEPTMPDWHWHVCCDGVPPAMKGPGKTSMFSARWTTRIRTSGETNLHFSSLASGGSRIILDDATVLDAWQEWGSTYTSELTPAGAGYHYLIYEYRSADSNDAAPANSYICMPCLRGQAHVDRLKWLTAQITLRLLYLKQSCMRMWVGWLVLRAPTWCTVSSRRALQ
jgi:hypothetical protein